MIIRELDIEKDEISIISLISWISKLVDNEISKKCKNKILKQKAVRAILSCLSVNEGLTQNEISRLSTLKSSTISVALTTLEQEGIIYKEESLTDLRKILIYLTEKGQFLKKDLDIIIVEVENRLSKGISTKEIHNIKTLILNMGANLK